MGRTEKRDEQLTSLTSVILRFNGIDVPLNVQHCVKYNINVIEIMVINDSANGLICEPELYCHSVICGLLGQ